MTEASSPAAAGTTLHLDGRALTDAAAVHSALRAGLPLPAHYGNTLDALYDCLTTDITGPVTILWHHASDSRDKLGREFDEFQETLKDAADDNPELDVTFED